jgi:Na+/proline symporter
MTLATIDWIILVSYLAMTLLIGVAVARNAGRTTADYFLSGRHMPWWLLGATSAGA